MAALAPPGLSRALPPAPRRRRLAAPLAGALLLAAGLSAGCGERPAPRTAVKESRRGLAPGERGELRARGDIAAGKLRVYVYGDPAASTDAARDPSSGLPLRTLPDCCVTPEQREETGAYNRVMREAAARGGAPAR